MLSPQALAFQHGGSSSILSNTEWVCQSSSASISIQSRFAGFKPSIHEGPLHHQYLQLKHRIGETHQIQTRLQLTQLPSVSIDTTILMQHSTEHLFWINLLAQIYLTPLVAWPFQYFKPCSSYSYSSSSHLLELQPLRQKLLFFFLYIFSSHFIVFTYFLPSLNTEVRQVDLELAKLNQGLR